MNYTNNIRILEENDIRICGQAWDDKPDSVELETYTDAGEDMIFCLEAPTKAELQAYIDGFDKDEAVMLWWQNGKEAAASEGMPHNNICEHYEDHENYLKDLQRVCDLLS